jgi:hypothetical protein
MSAPPRARRWPWILAGVAIVLVGAIAFGLRLALREIERDVAQALGPGAQVAAIRASTTAVVIEGLSIPGTPDWPAPAGLRAARVRVFPTWRSLLSRPIDIARIEVESPYLSMLRTRDGRLRVLPTLVERKPDGERSGGGGESDSVSIGQIHLQGGELDFYDETVARKPWRIRLVGLDARLHDVRAPGLAGHMPFGLTGVLDGPQRDGHVAIQGWLDAATRDLELRAVTSGIDLLALEPYLVEAAKARLSRGTLDLDLHATVEQQRLYAPGHLTFSDLAFASNGSPTARAFGVPRDVLLAAVQAKGGRISLDFTLDGRLDDPHFSLNETMATRVGVAVAKELGISVGGLVEGTLGIGREGLEGAGGAARGVGEALRRMIPGQ